MQSTTYRQPGLRVTEHTLKVPLDHAQPAGEPIEVFALAVVLAEKADAAQPWLIFLQGGRGFERPRPVLPDSPGWLSRALADCRVLLLDQRGMGRSTPLSPADASAAPPQALADRLALHRADAIVRDPECFRQALDVDLWSVLGQSFGGFCAVSYLSMFPGSLREAFITGGLPPLDRGVDEVYRETYRTAREDPTTLRALSAGPRPHAQPDGLAGVKRCAAARRRSADPAAPAPTRDAAGRGPGLGEAAQHPGTGRREPGLSARRRTRIAFRAEPAVRGDFTKPVMPTARPAPGRRSQ